MKIATVGIDLVKNVFQVHGVNEHGKCILKKQIKRSQMIEFFANLQASLVGTEACGGAHYWARRLQTLGHTVRLIAPQFVKPYVKTNKNDAADAEAICEAVARPNMRFVPVKNVEQQAMLAVHRARQGFVIARTAQANQIRGLLAEFGIVFPQGLANIRSCARELIEDGRNELPGSFRLLIERLLDHLAELDKQVEELEAQIRSVHSTNEMSRKLEKIPGIGPITASALVATIGDARDFTNGRQLAAWMGLVPGQSSSGGKTTLLGISKRGDVYLRTLLIHGARAALRAFQNKADHSGDNWLRKLLERRHFNVVAVALANRNARVIWALLARNRQYQANYKMNPAV